MKDDLLVRHMRGKSVVDFPGGDFPELDSITLEYQGKQTIVPVQRNESFLSFEIPHELLLDVIDIRQLKLITNLQGLNVNLLEVNGYEDLLECFDVDSTERFWSRVASTARPIRDENLLRLVCKRAVNIHRDFAVLGASLCALGYRILDADDANDPDIQWVFQHSERLFQWEEKVTPYDDARWGTSVLMLLAYIHLNFKQMKDALVALNRLLHYRSAIKVAPLIQTNLVRTSMILADYEMSQGNFDRALSLLEEVPRIAKEGIWWSDLTEPVAGAFKYTEFDVVVCGAKEALKLIFKMNELIEKNQRRACRLQDLGGYAGVLIRRERLNYAS